MFQFNVLYPDATDLDKMTQIRSWRNNELTVTDWTQLSDAKCDKAAWAAYRQALRDLPAQNDDPTKIVIPQRP